MMHSEILVEDFALNMAAFANVEWLLQQLLMCNGTLGIAMVDGEPLAEETVLEVEMDGFHYILKRTWPEISAAKYRLSPREQEIVDLVAKGYPNKSIAAVLNISPSTVATHIRRIFDKLNAKSRAEMVARVLENKV